MNMEKAFDLFIHMNDPETRDKQYKMGDVVLEPRQQAKVLNKSIQAFVHKTGRKEGEKIIQAFTGSSDLPVLTKDVFNVVNEVPNYDLAWQDAFKGISLKKGQLQWEIATAQTDALFSKIPEGGKIEFHRYTGEKVTIDIDKYGMGIGITWETIEGRKLYQFIDQMEQVRSKLYALWAEVHYGLLATAGALNTISWQTGTDYTVTDRDIATINLGYSTLGAACKDKGYGDTANAEMLLYASPALKSRINRALRATNLDGTGNGLVVEYNVSPRYTWNSAITANKALLVLPKNKIQNSVYLRELGLNRQEQESLNELRSYWTAFGAAVADTDQVYELSFS